jgi:hypothetical protein
MEHSPSWETNRSSASQEIPCTLWNLKVHCHVHKHLSPVRIPNQSNPVDACPSHFFKINFTSIFPSMPNLPSCLFISGLPTKTLYAPLLSQIRAVCSTHLIILDLITWMIFGEQYRAYGCSLCSLLHSPVTLSLLDQSIFLSTLLLNILSLYSYPIVRDQVSHACKTTGRITVVCILIFIFVDSKLEDKKCWTRWLQALPNFSLLLMFSWMVLWFVRVVPK